MTDALPPNCDRAIYVAGNGQDVEGNLCSYNENKTESCRMTNQAKTLEKLEILQIIYSQGGYSSDLVERTLDKLIAHEITTAQQEAEELKAELQAFEEKYQMSSEDFYQRFRLGEMGDAVDFVEWSAFYQMWASVQKRLEILQGQPT